MCVCALVSVHNEQQNVEPSSGICIANTLEMKITHFVITGLVIIRTVNFTAAQPVGVKYWQ